MSDTPDTPAPEPDVAAAAAGGAAAADELDQLAEAITVVAGARKRIELPRLLRETALNILILSRIASNRLPKESRQRREDIESATDHLVTQLRHAGWELPPDPVAAAFPAQAPDASVDTGTQPEPETFSTTPAPEL